MSIPKNHHHVSQCHIRYFKNSETDKYYLYNKEFDFFEKPKTSEKSIFSEDFANTRFIDGELDHKFLEDELNLNFEGHFFEHVENIIQFVSNNPSIESQSIEKSLNYIIRYAIILDMRHPHYKK